MKETKNDSTVVENTFFRFLTWNVPRHQKSTKLISFPLRGLIDVALLNTALYEKKHSKEYRKHRLNMEIMTGEVSVMMLGSYYKKRYFYI